MKNFLENNITSKSCLIKKILSVHTKGTKKFNFFDFSCFANLAQNIAIFDENVNIYLERRAGLRGNHFTLQGFYDQAL